MLYRLLFSFVVFTSVTAFGDAQHIKIADQIRFPVHKFKLENGLTVLIHEDYSTPLVSIHQWFRVGSRYEKIGMTGIAHFFEHMMFKGSENFPPGSFDRLIQANGGTNNAFTTYDYTGYYVDLPASKLELILKMEADRMVNLLFDPKTIQSEREVVKEERRYRTDNSVYGYLNEAVFATVFKVHPYRWPVVGSMKDLNSISVEQFKQFYKTYYAPNNAVVVLAGAINAEKAKKLVTQLYGHLKSQELPDSQIPQEPEQKSQRRLTLKKDVAAPYLTIAYKSVQSGHKDQYAFDLLSNILSEGNSSRLYRKLVYHDQLLSSVSTWAFTPKDPGIFEVMALLKPGHSTKRVERTIFNEIAKLRKELVSEKELEKAKNQVMKSYVDSMKTVSGKARLLATNEILFGDYQVLFQDLDNYLAVTREQIRDVAKTYLNTNQSSIVKVLPK